MLKKALNCALLLGAAMTAELAGAGELTLYTRDDFAGRSLSVRNGAADLRERDFNDTAQSVRVRVGYWEVCEDVDFRGRCRTLGPGEYASLERLSNRISSVREVR